MSTDRQSLQTIWHWPALLALATAFGLLAALLGQTTGWWLVSWIALAIPLGVAGIAIGRLARNT